MGNISLGHSSALDASGKLHQFGPGEVLPDWVTAKRDSANSDAVGQFSGESDEVGLIIARAENDAAGIIAKAEAEAAEILANAQAQASGADVDVSDDNGKDEESTEPDFTKPAQPKRGRPAKSQA